jgi:hypothetical protein
MKVIASQGETTNKKPNKWTRKIQMFISTIKKMKQSNMLEIFMGECFFRHSNQGMSPWRCITEPLVGWCKWKSSVKKCKGPVEKPNILVGSRHRRCEVPYPGS